MPALGSSPYVIDAANSTPALDASIGGKARNLLRLASHGLRVPEFICVSSTAYEVATRPAQSELRQLLRTCRYDRLDDLHRTSARARSLILACDIPAEVLTAVQQGLGKLSGGRSFSVRSSAENEDGRKHSFAGQLGTWLNVAPAAVLEKIRLCWASAFEPGVLTYLYKLNRHLEPNPVAVIIQRMVDAQSAGVMFQADPRGDVQRQVIVAGYGLGEGIVSDRVETDSYVHNKLNDTWELTIAEKRRRVRCHAEGGTEEIAISGTAMTQPVLDDGQRAGLIRASAKIATLYQDYQDIEWAFDRDAELYILQSRPITTIPGGFQRAFDNSNIMESYPGVVLPMTFSILHLDYRLCIEHALLRFGVPRRVIEKRADVLEHLVGYVNGRSYYNIGNWYRTLQVVPFFKTKIIDYFEQMIGTEGSYEDGFDDLRLSRFERWRLAFGFTTSFVRNLVRHDRLVRDYFSTTERIRREFQAIELEHLSSDELIGYLGHFAHRFMAALGVPIVNDFFTMIFMAVTKEQFKRHGIDGSLVNKLLANQQVESRKPVESLGRLADRLRSDAALRATLDAITAVPADNTLPQITARLAESGFREFADRLAQHFQLYGHRAPKELVMESDTFKENPFQLLRILSESASVLRKHSAEGSEADESLPDRTLRKRPLLRWLVRKTRQAIAYREATRLDRGLHFSFFRTLLHRIGVSFVEEGVLSDSRDIFYLTLDELDDYRKGCSANGDLRGLVDYRKAQAHRWSGKEQDGKLFTRGTVYANAMPSAMTISPAGDGRTLQGVGCSQGIVTAEARVVTDPNSQTDVKGKILVSETTDPGWVFLMTLSAGLISERGSLLSHTAIIGRELGIPTIVGVKGASRLIAEGASITMNGETGRIELEPPVTAGVTHEERTG